MSGKITKAIRAGVVTQVVDCLPNKCGELISNFQCHKEEGERE
jgi:hypothetical protein